MCSPARCLTCGLTTWSGCGAHVDRVMRGVPEAERCTCEDRTPTGRTRTARRTVLSRLLGR